MLKYSLGPMADDYQMKKFRENPDLFRLHLLDAFKECTAEIKGLTRGIAPEGNELPEHLETQLMSQIGDTVNQSFKNNNIETLVKELKKLEDNSPDDPAWRPTTGVVDLSAEKERALLKHKEKLQSMIEERAARIGQLKGTITEKRNNLRQHYAELHKHMEDVNKFNEQK